MFSVIGTHALSLNWQVFLFSDLYPIRQIAKLKTLPKFLAIQYMCNAILRQSFPLYDMCNTVLRLFLMYIVP